MQGFIVTDFADGFQAAQKELAQWIAEGKIKRNETIVKGGLENIETAWQELFRGANTGESETRSHLARFVGLWS